MTTKKLPPKLPAFEGYCKRIGAVQKNFRRWVIEEEVGHGYTAERAHVSINLLARKVYYPSDAELAPTEAEKEAIAKEVATADFIASVQFKNKEHILKHANKDNPITFFKDRKTGKYIMALERIVKKDGITKQFIPWTVWEDGETRPMEPDTKLPLWKPEHTRDIGKPIMIHEGDKAAQFVDDLVNNPARREELKEHPWGAELQQYEHWGWIGGAENPHRTDWRSLPDHLDIVVVADNDPPGMKAIPKIAEQIKRPMRAIMFNDSRFDGGFDLANKFPDELWVSKGDDSNERFYEGPTMEDMTQPATWATKRIAPQGKGAPKFVLEKRFPDEWVRVGSPSVFINWHWPTEMMSKARFNEFIAPFSDVEDTAVKLDKEIVSKFKIVTYRPGSPRKMKVGSNSAFNIWSEPRYKPVPGDAGPWEEYIEHLIPREDDRLLFKRYLATLIARPDVRMFFGMLLVSETQGVGKSILGWTLRQLVGEGNFSSPRESDIVEGKYNNWVVEKRLVFVHEIFASRNYKAYDKLKEYISEKEAIMVEKKFIDAYPVENWAHFIVCSNYLRAMSVPNEDRRWFIPEVTETKLTNAKATAFLHWLKTGGYSIIMAWAEEFLKKNKPFKAGEEAPMTERKLRVIDESRTPDAQVVFDFAKALVARSKGAKGKHAVLRGNELRNAIAARRNVPVKEIDKLQYLIPHLLAAGMFQHPGTKTNKRISTTTGSDLVFATFAMKGSDTWTALSEKGGERSESDLWKDVYSDPY